MTHLPVRTVLDDEGLDTRLPLLARQPVAVHAVRPADRPQEYVALTTADTVVTPGSADTAVWAAAIDVIRKPPPRHEGRFLHGTSSRATCCSACRPRTRPPPSVPGSRATAALEAG